MPDLLSSPLFQPPMIYIIIIGFVFVFSLLMFIKFKRKSEDVIEHFNHESLEDILKKETFEKYMATFGRKTKKGCLFWNMGIIKINKVLFLRMKLEERKTKTTTEIKPIDFIIFQKGSFLSNLPIFNKIKTKEYFVVDNTEKFITKDKYNDKWVINPDVNMHLFGGIWIGSSYGLNYLTELMYKRTYESEKEIEINTPKRFVWYNDIYASKFTGDILSNELEQSKYDKRVERETGVKKPKGN